VELTAEEDAEGAAMLAMYDDLAAAQEKEVVVEEVVDMVVPVVSVRIVVFPEVWE
jgi:hypothetical protein